MIAFAAKPSDGDGSQPSILVKAHEVLYAPLYRDGYLMPMQHELCSLVSYIQSVPSPPATDVLTALFFVLFANTASSTHNHFGEMRILGPLTGFQAGDGITLFLKTFVLERLLGDLRLRALVYLTLSLSLVAQWPFMLTMFSEAPYPYVHIVAEVGSAWSAFERWRMAI